MPAVVLPGRVRDRELAFKADIQEFAHENDLDARSSQRNDRFGAGVAQD
jgi:hypothetical protein